MIGIRDRSKGHFKNGNKDFRSDFWFFFFPFLIFSFSGIIALLHETFFFFEVGVAPHDMQSFPGGTSGKESARGHKGLGFDSCVGKIPWRRKWQPTPVFLPEDPVDRGAWWFTVHGVAKSQTQLSNWACTGMQVLSSMTEDGTQAPCSEVQKVNHWTTREVLSFIFPKTSQSFRKQTKQY